MLKNGEKYSIPVSVMQLLTKSRESSAHFHAPQFRVPFMLWVDMSSVGAGYVYDDDASRPVRYLQVTCRTGSLVKSA